MKKAFFLVLYFSIFFSKGNTNLDSVSISVFFDKLNQLPEKKDSLFKEILKIYNQHPSSKSVHDAYFYNLAKYLIFTGQTDSAKVVANKGYNFYANKKDTLRLAKYHNLTAMILAYDRKFYEAIEEYKKALEIYDHYNQPYQSALIKSNIANIFFSLLDYSNAYKYSRDANLYLKSINDSVYLPAIGNILGLSLIKLNQPVEGKKITMECLQLSEKYKNLTGLIIGYYSLGEYFLSQNKNDSAVYYFSKSYELSHKNNLFQYVLINHLGLMAALINQKKFSAAIDTGKKALKYVDLLHSEDKRYTIYKNLGFSYASLGDFKNAYDYLLQAHQLFLKTSNAETQRSINELLIKYETGQKEKLLMKKDLELIKSQMEINKSKYQIGLLILLLMIFLLIFTAWLFISKQKEKRKKEKLQLMAVIEGEEKERKRISEQLHDTVGSEIAAIKFDLEKNDTFFGIPSQINKRLDSVYDELRTISHNLMPTSFKEFPLNDLLKNYCIENSREHFKIYFHSNLPNEDNFNPAMKSIIYRMIQELVNNARKHSLSQVCHVTLNLKGKYLIISVEDEGNGMEIKDMKNGQGLMTIKSRTEALGGKFLIETSFNQGTVIHIMLPVT